MVYGRGPQGIVDIARAGILGLHNVALARNADYRRRQSHEIAAHGRRAAVTVVDDDDLASVRPPPIAAQQAIGLVVANDGASVFADDNAAGFLDQDSVALAHLAAGAAHVIETSGVVLRWGRHKGALCLCSGRPGWRRRELQGRRSNRGGSDRLLWRDR